MDALKMFSSWYAGYHGYLSLVVCIVGVVCNVFIVVVLTRRNLTTTVNYLLTALAVSDMLTMTSYIPFALQFYCLHGTTRSPDRNSYRWTLFLWFHVNFSITTHTASIWIGVLLAAFRFSYVRSTSATREGSASSSTSAGGREGLRRTRCAVAAVGLLSVFVLLPNYFSVTIEAEVDIESNRTIYDVASTVNSSADGFDQTVAVVNFWTQALVVKLVPCLLMSLFGVLLIRALMTSHRKRSAILTNSSTTTQRSWQRRHYRTTTILVVIIILFLVTELPHGTLALCSGLIPDFFETYYVPLGDVMDIVALVNNGINFTLYCLMSNRFRQTFLELFCVCGRRMSFVVLLRQKLVCCSKTQTSSGSRNSLASFILGPKLSIVPPEASFAHAHAQAQE